MKKRLSLLAFLIACMLLVPTVVLASYEYYIPIEVYNNDSEAVSGMPVLVSINNSQLADYGYIAASGLDTAMLEGSNSRDYLVVDNKTFIMIPSIESYQTRTYNYRLGNTPSATGFPFSAGYGGYVTIDDDDDLELRNNFSIEFEGGIDIGTSTYPVIEATAESTEDAQVTSHDVSLPTGIEEDDLLVMVFGGLDPDSGTPTITAWPSGWIELDQVNVGATVIGGVAYKIATGSEGATAIVTTSALDSCYSAHQTFRISNYQGVPEISAEAHDANVNPNSASLSPSWGVAEGTLYMSVFGGGNLGARTISSYPSGYWDGDLTKSSAGYAYASSTIRAECSTSENPGQWTASGIIAWVAWTLGIDGEAPPLMRKPDAFDVFISGDYLGAMIDGTTPLFVSTTLTADEYLVEVWADETNFGIDIDGVTENSTALAGASVPLNANDFLLSIPYYEYYKHSVNGTQEAWYQPNTMVIGTQLTDRSGNGHHGVITWGSNPSTIEVTIGGLQPFSAFTASDEEEENEAPWVVPDTGNIPTAPTPGATGVGLPLYVNFKSAADSLDWSVPVMYSVAFIIISIVLGAAGLVAMGTGWGFTIGCGATMAFFGQVQDGGGYHVLPIGLAIAIVIVSIILGWLWSRT